MSPLVVSVLLLNISCEKCIAFTNGGVGGVVSIGGTVGAAAKVAPKKKTLPSTWEVEVVLSICSLTSTLA